MVTKGEDHVEIMDCGQDLIGVKDKFEGGVMGADGYILYPVAVQDLCQDRSGL